MNDKQLDQAKKQLREEMNSLGFGYIDGKYIKPPKEYELRSKKLSCIDMINSILCYNCQGYTNAEAVMQYEENVYYNYLADYVKVLGRKKVVALIQGQINSIAGVRHCVHIDSEGVSYNSIVWKEETV